MSEFVDRLFRDEDRIDSNIFIKVCKENDCFVHISSKRMTYNFANDQHAEMFKLEVQMAALYIKDHVKGTMLRRRDMVVKAGQWGGMGAIPVGYIICNDEKSPLYGKFIPYEPHAKVILWIFIRFIEIGYDFAALRNEIREMSVVFPAFLPGVPIIRFMLTPTQDGYIISEDTLRYILTNEVYIGTFRRQIQGGEVYIEKNHPAIVPKEIFWSVYDHMKDVRPDGTPTGRVKQIRYSQENIWSDRQPLLKPVSEDGSVYWSSYNENLGNYKIIKRKQLGTEVTKFEQALQQDTLGTLEEELEELWPLKPFAERKALLGLLIKSLSVKFLSPHFYHIEISWNYDNWGVEQTILYRGTSGSKEWTEAELSLIADLYPTATQLEMLQAMPTRTWATIYTQAYRMGVARNRRSKVVYPKKLTLLDVKYLEENHLTLADFQEYKYNSTVVNHTAWRVASLSLM